MKNLLQNQAIKILQRPKSLTIFSKDYECAPLLHQPTGKHKTQRISEVGKQGLEVSRCTPPVIESCIPTIRHYQDALSHSKPIPMDWPNPQEGDSVHLEHLQQRGSQSVCNQTDNSLSDVVHRKQL